MLPMSDDNILVTHGGGIGLKTMSERYERPDWVRRLIALGDSLGDDGARALVPLDADAMLVSACRSLGKGDVGNVEDFGDFGDPDWEDRFRKLVTAVDAAPLHAVGRLITRQELQRSLRTRLLLAQAWEREPTVRDESIVAPLIVTGPARSGTSILFELLWLDPALRAPLAWEGLHPFPFEEDDAGSDRRLAVTECEQELWADLQPEFAAMHELRSDLPIECVTLTQACFCGPHWSMVVGGAVLPDMAEMYAFHVRMLKVLQYGSMPERTWLLKTPSHLATLDLVFATYPDAWIVQTHRDPAKTMPSTVSIAAMVQWMRSDHVDLEMIRTRIDLAFGGILNQVAERRTQNEFPNRFVDIHFQSLLRDPVDTLRRAYDRMGREFSDGHGEAIARYLSQKTRGKFGVHKYTPEEWGFDRSALHKQLATYIKTFDVELED
jgi:hypothetical protein